jgi:hypothetical protein
VNSIIVVQVWDGHVDHFRGGETGRVEHERRAAAAFRARLSVPRLDLNLVAAVGAAAGEEPVETDPQAEVKWSRDGGYRYGVPVRRALGREGEGARSVSVNRLGLCSPKGYRFHVRVSDLVPVTLFGAALGGVETRAAG